MVSREFLLAGRAIFTAEHGGERRTYQVVRPEVQLPLLPYVVRLLAGPCNLRDYVNLAVLFPDRRVLRILDVASHPCDSAAVRLLQWSLRSVFDGVGPPAGSTIANSGHCGRCGRLLTVPESIRTGLGPECAARAGAASP